MPKLSRKVVSRRDVLAGAAKGALLAATGTGGFAAPAIAQQNKDRIIMAMSQEPVQFNPLLYVNTGTENVPESCMFDALWDVDENEYVDYVGALGPIVLGYVEPEINDAVIERMSKGFCFSLVQPEQNVLEQRLIDLIPSAEQAILVKTGSDATSAGP